MIRALRVIGLAVRVSLRSPLKLILLVTLIAISFLVFLTVSELSHASTTQLDDAISSDLGAAGTYRAQFSEALDEPASQVVAASSRALTGVAVEPIQGALRYPPLSLACTQADDTDDLTPVVLISQDGTMRQANERSGGAATDPLADESSDSQPNCLNGLVLPSGTVRTATPQEKTDFGADVVLDASVNRAMLLASPRPATLLLLVRTGREREESTAIHDKLSTALESTSMRAGLDPDQISTVQRADSGATVRSASRGIALVYSLIGWGVLLVSGLAVLVAELIVLRDRRWYFGLSRALGARRSHVAGLILADSALVVGAGLITALLLTWAATPLVQDFGRSAFHANLTLLRWSAMGWLAVGALVLLLIAGAYPAWRATRLDPLEVLERR